MWGKNICSGADGLIDFDSIYTQKFIGEGLGFCKAVQLGI